MIGQGSPSIKIEPSHILWTEQRFVAGDDRFFNAVLEQVNTALDGSGKDFEDLGKWRKIRSTIVAGMALYEANIHLVHLAQVRTGDSLNTYLSVYKLRVAEDVQATWRGVIEQHFSEDAPNPDRIIRDVEAATGSSVDKVLPLPRDLEDTNKVVLESLRRVIPVLAAELGQGVQPSDPLIDA